MTPSPVQTELLTYRPWRGRLGGPWRGALAIARHGLGLLVKRRLFWFLYACGLLIFGGFFFGQYLVAFAGSYLDEERINLSGNAPLRVDPKRLVDALGNGLKLNGSAETFRNLFWWEGYAVVIMLAFAGSLLIGNDFRHGSLPFYLAKPVGRRHYLIGKALAVAVVVNSLTTFLALLLWVEYGAVTEWSYWWDRLDLVGGILGYGLILSVVLTCVLLAAAAWVRKTVPLVMTWMALFAFLPAVGRGLADWREEPNWRLVDIWNCCYVTGNWCFGLELKEQPSPLAATIVLMFVCLLCLLFLRRSVRAVEIV